MSSGPALAGASCCTCGWVGPAKASLVLHSQDVGQIQYALLVSVVRDHGIDWHRRTPQEEVVTQLVSLLSRRETQPSHVWECGAKQTVYDVAAAPSGVLYTAGAQHGLSVIDGSDGSRRHPLANSSGFAEASDAMALTLSADGRYLWTGGVDGVLRKWSAETGGPEATCAGKWRRPIISVVLSARGDVVITVSEDGAARTWRAADGSLLQQFVCHESEVSDAIVSVDGASVYTGMHNGSICVWDAGTAERTATIEGHGASVFGMSVHGARPEVLYSGSGDGTVMSFDVVTNRKMLVLRGHVGPVTCVLHHPGGDMVYSGEFF
jgi:WD40 repeat protein